MDSEAGIVSAMLLAFRQQQAPLPEYEAVKAIIGLNLPEAVQELHPSMSSRDVDEVIANYRLNYRVQTPAPVLFPQVRETLLKLRHAGYSLAVATGKSRRGLARAIEETDLEDFFATTRTADESESKPSPAMLYAILEELEVEPHGALMIGDTEFDLAMAKAAGMCAAAVIFGAHSLERLSSYKPAFILDRFEDLPTQLQRLHAFE
jgi:phosphoglycolate phosphatase